MVSHSTYPTPYPLPNITSLNDTTSDENAISFERSYVSNFIFDPSYKPYKAPDLDTSYDLEAAVDFNLILEGIPCQPREEERFPQRKFVEAVYKKYQHKESLSAEIKKQAELLNLGFEDFAKIHAYFTDKDVRSLLEKANALRFREDFLSTLIEVSPALKNKIIREFANNFFSKTIKNPEALASFFIKLDSYSPLLPLSSLKLNIEKYSLDNKMILTIHKILSKYKVYKWMSVNCLRNLFNQRFNTIYHPEALALLPSLEKAVSCVSLRNRKEILDFLYSIIKAVTNSDTNKDIEIYISALVKHDLSSWHYGLAFLKKDGAKEFFNSDERLNQIYPSLIKTVEKVKQVSNLSAEFSRKMWHLVLQQRKETDFEPSVKKQMKSSTKKVDELTIYEVFEKPRKKEEDIFGFLNKLFKIVDCSRSEIDLILIKKLLKKHYISQKTATGLVAVLKSPEMKSWFTHNNCNFMESFIEKCFASISGNSVALQIEIPLFMKVVRKHCPLSDRKSREFLERYLTIKRNKARQMLDNYDFTPSMIKDLKYILGTKEVHQLRFSKELKLDFSHTYKLNFLEKFLDFYQSKTPQDSSSCIVS